MKIIAHTKGKPCTLMIKLKASEPTKIYLKVSDSSVKNTDYTNRFMTIEGEETLFVRLPKSPEKAEIQLKSEKELTGEKDNSYKVIDLQKLPLKRKLTAFNHANPTIRRFVAFAEEFSQKAGYISANGSIYTSDDGQFRIDYLDDIVGNNGKSLKTPARISRAEGIIEVSKKKFEKYTVPMRMAILLHEFSHYYLNTDMSNETEADLNGLIIYLGLGYPRIDAYNVFTQVFVTSPNEVNHERMRIIDNFIRNFEKKYVEMNYNENSLYKNYL
jgi:hypothetical protein